jgi:hypothetical protein
LQEDDAGLWTSGPVQITPTPDDIFTETSTTAALNATLTCDAVACL